MRIAEFYQYLRRREAIRLRRELGLPWPWTSDPILQKYRFTNVKRLHDRTTQVLLTKLYQPGCDNYEREVKLGTHEAGHKALEYLLTATIARYFGTWEFALAVGWQQTWDPDRVRSIAEMRRASGEPVFTTAYMISNMGEARPKVEVVCEFVESLWLEASQVLDAIDQRNSWKDGIRRMQEIRGFGGSGFMAKEILLDTMLVDDGQVWEWDERTGCYGPGDMNTWCPAGPGARRGVCRVLDLPPTNIAESRCLPVMLELLASKDEYWPEGPRLDLHDIQFGLCEFDKYERARTRQGEPKRRYRQPR